MVASQRPGGAWQSAHRGGAAWGRHVLGPLPRHPHCAKHSTGPKGENTSFGLFPQRGHLSEPPAAFLVWCNHLVTVPRGGAFLPVTYASPCYPNPRASKGTGADLVSPSGLTRLLRCSQIDFGLFL